MGLKFSKSHQTRASASATTALESSNNKWIDENGDFSKQSENGSPKTIIKKTATVTTKTTTKHRKNYYRKKLLQTLYQKATLAEQQQQPSLSSSSSILSITETTTKSNKSVIITIRMLKMETNDLTMATTAAATTTTTTTVTDQQLNNLNQSFMKCSCPNRSVATTVVGPNQNYIQSHRHHHDPSCIQSNRLVQYQTQLAAATDEQQQQQHVHLNICEIRDNMDNSNEETINDQHSIIGLECSIDGMMDLGNKELLVINKLNQNQKYSTDTVHPDNKLDNNEKLSCNNNPCLNNDCSDKDNHSTKCNRYCNLCGSKSTEQSQTNSMQHNKIEQQLATNSQSSSNCTCRSIAESSTTTTTTLNPLDINSTIAETESMRISPPPSSSTSSSSSSQLTQNIRSLNDERNGNVFMLPSPTLLDFSRFNPDEYPIEDCDEKARIQRALEIAEGVEPTPGFVPSTSFDQSASESESTSIIQSQSNNINNLPSMLSQNIHFNTMQSTIPIVSATTTTTTTTGVFQQQQQQLQSTLPPLWSLNCLPNGLQFAYWQNGEQKQQQQQFHQQPQKPTVHSQVDYEHCLVPDLKKITNSCFYWGKMDRYEAERLLDGKPEGTFLLRDSAQEEFLFSVSFRKYGRSLHARIEQFNHKFSFDCHDPGVYTSSTITGLLEHYKDPACVMFFEPALTLPLNRNFCFTLQQLCRATIVSNTKYDGINQLTLPKTLKSYLKEYHYKQRLRTIRLDDAPPVLYTVS